MKKLRLIIAGLLIALLILVIIMINDKKRIASQDLIISELEDNVETLEKKVSTLEEEKSDLVNKVPELMEINTHSHLPGISTPNYPITVPQPFYPEISQPITGTGFAVVVYKPSSCDYFILENSSGFIIAEWMGSNDPDVGDKVSGNFNSFGTRDFYNQSRDRECRLWVEDYMLSKESALDKIREKCN